MGGETTGEEGKEGKVFFLLGRQDGLLGKVLLLLVEKGTE